MPKILTGLNRMHVVSCILIVHKSEVGLKGDKNQDTNKAVYFLRNDEINPFHFFPNSSKPIIFLRF